jgi:hypothetical protein
VTRHAVFVVATVSVGAVDVDREFDGPLVTVEFRRDVVFDDTTPALAKFRCDLLPPFDDRRDVGEVVGVQQCETLTVVELGIEVDGLDLRVKAFEHAEELGEDTAGGVTVFETAHRQRVAFVSHPRVEGSIGVEGGSAVFGFGVVEAVCLVFIAVVGPQVEVSDDLHLLGEVFDDISLKQEIANGSDGVEVELGAEVMKNVGAGGSIVAVLAEFGDRGPVGARADGTSKMSSGSISAFSPRFRENAPVRVLTRKLRSWSSWISSSTCCFVVTPSASGRFN